MTSLSIIIPAYERVTDVLTCLNSLAALAARPDAIEWIVQDDASPSVLLAAVVPPYVNAARNPANRGFAGNCNAGAARASGDVLLFVNQDVFAVYGVSEGWDEAVRRAFDDAAVGIVGARLLFPDGSVQSAGGTFDQKGQPLHRCLGWRNPAHPLVSEAREVEWVTGAALAVRRDLFAALGGFDEGYVRGYFEDVDLCLRAREAGYTVRYEPGCTLVHQVGTSGGNAQYFMRNARRFKERWVDTGKVRPGTAIPTVGWW